jgi:hypothetical protein
MLRSLRLRVPRISSSVRCSVRLLRLLPSKLSNRLDNSIP